MRMALGGEGPLWERTLIRRGVVVGGGLWIEARMEGEAGKMRGRGCVE